MARRKNQPLTTEIMPAKRDAKGRFLERPEAAKRAEITKETAGDMVRRRWEKYRQAAADAVAEELGSSIPNATTPFAAWGVLNARLAQTIIDSDKPRGDDLRVLGQHIGAIPNASERSTGENASAGTVAADPETLVQLLELLDQVRRSERDKAQAIDGEVDE